MEVGQPGTGAAARRRRGGDPRAAGGRADGLYRGLRAALAPRAHRAHYAERYGAAVPMERVAVTVGASGAFPLAFLAAFDAGDAVAMAAPYYPPYVNILTALGMRRS